jgi:hypothetical protein
LDAPEAQKTTKLDRKMPQPGNCHPGLFNSLQAILLELWDSFELLRPPGTQLDTFLDHFDTSKHRKRPDFTGKCLKKSDSPDYLLKTSRQDYLMELDSLIIFPLSASRGDAFWARKRTQTKREISTLLSAGSRRPKESNNPVS